MPGAYLSDALQVALGGYHHSILPLDRLHMEGSTVGIRDGLLHKQGKLNE